MKVYGGYGVGWWNGTADIAGEDSRFERHYGEGFRLAYTRAW